MHIESIYIGLPVYHKDSASCMTMTVRQVLPTGHVVCAWIEHDGREIEKAFWPNELEPGALKFGGSIIG
ncbi:hypothetical protein [Aeromonas veronii]|uniref:DUF2158 domain-containing protein n=1 Tax=Aeromonas veronii TaxID=654 RepID=A0AAW5MHV9_AERVE|nr:hypothetical protein [Aeromonas veronii]MCR4450377.1 hypothetical protein [Aeromonas veronii]